MFITIFSKHCCSEIDHRCGIFEKKSYYFLYRNLKTHKILMKTIKLVKSLVQFFTVFVSLYVLKSK